MPLLYTSFLGSGSGNDAPAEGGGTPGAIAEMDFVNGYYYAGGSTRVVGDMLGGSFDGSSIDASGMFMDLFGGSNFPSAIGSLFTDIEAGLATGMSIVIELDSTVGVWAKPVGPYLTITDTANISTAVEYIDLYTPDSSGSVYMTDTSTLATNDTGGDWVSRSINKIGFTLYRDIGGGSYESAHVVNAGTVYTDTTAYAGNFFTVGGIDIFSKDSEGDCLADIYIRHFVLYPAKNNSELSALTVL